MGRSGSKGIGKNIRRRSSRVERRIWIAVWLGLLGATAALVTGILDDPPKPTRTAPVATEIEQRKAVFRQKAGLPPPAPAAPATAAGPNATPAPNLAPPAPAETPSAPSVANSSSTPPPPAGVLPSPIPLPDADVASSPSSPPLPTPLPQGGGSQRESAPSGPAAPREIHFVPTIAPKPAMDLVVADDATAPPGPPAAAPTAPTPDALVATRPVLRPEEPPPNSPPPAERGAPQERHDAVPPSTSPAKAAPPAAVPAMSVAAAPPDAPVPPTEAVASRPAPRDEPRALVGKPVPAPTPPAPAAEVATARAFAAIVPPRPRLPVPPAPIPESGPALAIIIDDLGPGPAASREAIELPVAVTLSFLPYADDLPMLTAAARARGHEILVHLPMEPIGTEDPGPNALLSRLTPEEMLRRAVWAFDRVPGAVGMNNHMGSRLTAQPAAMRLVLEEARRHGLFFVDSRTSPASIAYDVAERLGMKATSRDVFLDNDPESRAVLDQLDAAERLARRTGTALAIGHPHPSTMKVLANWLPAATSRGLRIVSTSRLIALRSCGVAMVLPVAACVSGGTDCGPKPAC